MVLSLSKYLQSPYDGPGTAQGIGDAVVRREATNPALLKHSGEGNNY